MSTTDAVFLNHDVQELFLHKNVVVLGDSIQRSVYKDLVCLWTDPCSQYAQDQELRAKGEFSFRHDKLLFGGEKINGIKYREGREYRDGDTVFRFYFITRCWDDNVQSIVHNDFKTVFKPDVIIMNSCLWDIHHYGREGKALYEPNLNKLMSEIRRLPSTPLLVWNSALPLAEYCKGGFLRKGFSTLPRHEIIKANDIAHGVINKFGFIYVDLFESIRRNSKFTQADDGIHWGNRAHRNMSNSILTAISRYWGIDVLDKVPSPVLLQSYLHDEWSPGPRYIDTPPRPMPPVPLNYPFWTPPMHNRYHPYAPPLRDDGHIPPPDFDWHSNRLHEYRSPFPADHRHHRRSYTDPFPIRHAVAQRYRNQQSGDHKHYRARFKKNMPRMPGCSPVARNGVLPGAADNHPATNTSSERSPLRESNVSVTPALGATPLAAKPVNMPDDAANIKNSDGISLKESNASVNPAVDATPLAAKPVNCKMPDDAANKETSDGMNSLKDSVVSNSTDNMQAVGSSVCNETCDINNNINVENERKRKRENENDDEKIQKPQKTTKLV
ncbi:hypothetical protein QZH41_006631 [Actinostola sp. cb2023]|nr:hypothetical protein QZH41_006631 [Actinostola sp. cb2023]